MIVTDFQGESRVRSRRELERRLRGIRKGEYGAFILAHRKNGPSLWIHFKREVAYLHYFPHPNFLVHAGYRTTGMTPPERRRGCRFRVLPDYVEEFGGRFIAVERDGLVSLQDAIVTAKVFFNIRSRPASVTWLEL